MIENTTRGTILAESIETCKTTLEKARGLMFRTSFSHGTILLFPFDPPQKPWIHMLFVFFPVDMLFLDKLNRVVYIHEAHPFEMFIRPPVSISFLLELPAGNIEASQTVIGDKIHQHIERVSVATYFEGNCLIPLKN